jgi:hypothetical protein
MTKTHDQFYLAVGQLGCWRISFLSLKKGLFWKLNFKKKKKKKNEDNSKGKNDHLLLKYLLLIYTLFPCGTMGGSAIPEPFFNNALPIPDSHDAWR